MKRHCKKEYKKIQNQETEPLVFLYFRGFSLYVPLVPFKTTLRKWAPFFLNQFSYPNTPQSIIFLSGILLTKHVMHMLSPRAVAWKHEYSRFDDKTSTERDSMYACIDVYLWWRCVQLHISMHICTYIYDVSIHVYLCPAFWRRLQPQKPSLPLRILRKESKAEW